MIDAYAPAALAAGRFLRHVWPNPSARWRFAVVDIPHKRVRFRAHLEPEQTSSPGDGLVSEPARKQAPPAAGEAPGLLSFEQRMADLGIRVGRPSHNRHWEFPEPLQVDADEMSQFVVELRRTGRL